MLLGILASILSLVLVIGVHELGHAIAARLAGVEISKISIGFGKPLFYWRSKHIQWIWALWPLGGYVQLMNTRIAPVLPKQWSHCFDKQAIGIRVLILLAGSLSNILMAWLCFILVFLMGLPKQLPIVASVKVGSAFARAGVLPGDQVVSLGNQATDSFQELGVRFIEFWGKAELKLEVRRASGELKQLSLDLSQLTFSSRAQSLLTNIGLVPDLKVQVEILPASSFSLAVYQANKALKDFLYFIFIIFKQLFLGVIPFSALLGPIGLFSITLASFSQGLSVFLYFIAMLSVAVAVVNLFPLPSLDGGSIMYALVEKIRGKPVSLALEVLIHRLFFIALCLLLIQLILNDLQRG